MAVLHGRLVLARYQPYGMESKLETSEAENEDGHLIDLS